MSRSPEGGPVVASAPVFAALGDETRLRLLTRLCERGPASITRLGEAVDVSRQAVTKHLRVLSEVGLVRSARHGREQIWELTPGVLDDARRTLDAISSQWDAALERLRQQVERQDDRAAGLRRGKPPTRGEP